MIEVSHCRMMFATELKNVKRGRIIERKKVFLRNARLLFNGRKKVFDAFRGGIFLFKTTYIRPGNIERILTPESPTTALIIEDI